MQSRITFDTQSKIALSAFEVFSSRVAITAFLVNCESSKLAFIDLDLKKTYVCCVGDSYLFVLSFLNKTKGKKFT